MRRLRAISIPLMAAALVAPGAITPRTSAATVPGTAPGDEPLASAGGLGLDPGEVVATTVVEPLADADAFAVAGDLEIAVVSSGVDTRVLPEPLRSHVSPLGDDGDTVGFGTYVASVILQMAPGAHITSLGVYPHGRFSAEAQADALSWADAHADQLDAVVYAVPPSEFLDPVSAVQAAGWWGVLLDSLSEAPLPGASGPIYGDALWSWVRSVQTDDRPLIDRQALDTFAGLLDRWTEVRVRIDALTRQGVAVVVPAGDLGSTPQSILGIANFPEVITVGGFDGSGISPSGSAGPSIDGHVKPDLLAPTGVAGLLPEASPVARHLADLGLLDPTLDLDWDAGEPVTSARTRIDSSMTAAAIVGAATAGMRAEGISDVDIQRGALTAAAVPVDGHAVWRQGAGVLRRTPDAEFASSRPLAAGHGDLGAEPASGPWAAAVGLTGPDDPLGAGTTLRDFVGVGADAGNVVRVLDPEDMRPPVSATVTNGGVELEAPVGDHPYDGGLYCGYTHVDLPASSDALDRSRSAEGIPEGTEQIPTCLVEGTRVDGFNHYIHKLPAENLTMGLLPALPAGRSILDQPLHLLPVNPFDAALFLGVSGPDGFVRFHNVPPGYYRVRQWSDYGTPMQHVVTDSASGAPQSVLEDPGMNPGYQDFETLVLSAVCSDTFDPATQADGDPCSEEHLEGIFGAENVRRDKKTATFVVTVAGVEMHVSFGFFKWMPGPAIASRQIDLVGPGDFEYLSATLAGALSAEWLDEVTDAPVPLWHFSSEPDDPKRLEATLNPAAAAFEGDVTLGIARYPIQLLTPNYTMGMSLNFSFELSNATIVPVVVVGGEVASGVVSPTGSVGVPVVGSSAPLGLDGTQLTGHAEGDANFEFHFKPRGAESATLYLLFVPPVSTPLAQASVGDLSFEIDTWTPALWPATVFPLPDPRIDLSAYPAGDPDVTLGSGHTFSFDPRFPSTDPGRFQQQITGACREIGNGDVAAEVCEDWTVVVHSPKDHAATFDVVDVSSGTSLVPDLEAAGARLFDPGRGTADFSHSLAFFQSSLPDIESSLTVDRALRTNGRFWEQFAVPMGVIEEFPGELQVRIQDYLPGRDSTFLPHATGPVAVAPYVPFIDHAAFIDPSAGDDP